MSLRRWPVYVLLLLTGALGLASLVLGTLNGSLIVTGDWGTGNLVYGLALNVLVYPAVGALIAFRRPGNSIGWICLGVGAALSVTAFASEYGGYALQTRPGSLPGGVIAAWVDSWLWVTFVVPVGALLPLLFPNGHLPSRRWRVVAVFAVTATIVTVVVAAFDPVLVNFPGIDNPLGTTALRWLEPFIIILPLSFVAAASSVVVRFRRSAGDERVQLKWFVYAATLLALSSVIAVALPFGSPGAALIAQDVMIYLLAALPIATGIAILKYRLYDIDRIINRTIVYGAVTAMLALGYLAAVLVLQAVLPVADDSPALVAASTLAVVALFRPLRGRIQRFVDRRFYRRRYDAERTVEAFGSRLRRQVDLEALRAELVAVSRETMQPEHASLWLKPPGASR